MLSATSQLSIKGAIETMLTWTSSKTNKSPPKDHGWQSSRDVFSIVVTPDRIPKFCIPSLEVDHLVVHSELVEDTQEKSMGSTIPGRMIKGPRATRSQSEWCIRKGVLCQETWCRRESLGSADVLFSSEHLERVGRHSDPVTRAALSLPHLSKITTPYGFLTLGESPKIRRKESLFFGYKSAELRIILPQKMENICPLQHPASPLMAPCQTRKWEKHSTKDLWPTAPEQLLKEQTAASLHHTLSSDRCANKCEKKRFQSLMKKHLPIVKKFRSHSAPASRIFLACNVIHHRTSPVLMLGPLLFCEQTGNFSDAAAVSR